jgi:peptidoglycan/LPS O-acetylase OafA/YrhL
VAWLVVFLLFRRHPSIDGQPDALFWSCGFGLLCAWQAAQPSRWLSHPIMQWLGERSYSIYLVHALVTFYLTHYNVYLSIWQALERSVGTWAYLPCLALTLAIVVPLSAVTYLLIERPGQKLGTIIIAARSLRTVTAIP